MRGSASAESTPQPAPPDDQHTAPAARAAPEQPRAADEAGDAGGGDLLGDVSNVEEVDLRSLLRTRVITSSGGRAEARALASANVTVVSSEQIRRRGWRSVADVLAHQPGLYMIDDLVIPSLGVRGATGGLRAGSRLVKVMINSVAVNFRPDLTSFLGPEFIPLEAIDRIEIVQGPLSALYGANAFIATVNVITRMPEAGVPLTEVSTRLSLTENNVGGGLSLLTVQGDEAAGFVFAASIDRLDRSGLQIDRTFEGQDPTLVRYETLLTETTSADISLPQSAYLRAHLGRPTTRWGRIALQAGIQRLDANAELRVGSAMSHRSRIAIDNWWTNLRHESTWTSKLSSTIDLGFSTAEPSRDSRAFVTDNPSASYAPRFRSHALQVGANLVYEPWEKLLKVRVGSDLELDWQRILFYQQTDLSGDRGGAPGQAQDLISPRVDRDQLLSDVGLGIQATGTPLPSHRQLTLTGELRLDFIQYGSLDIPTQVSWRTAAVYEWSPALVTKIIAGRAFQTPSAVLAFAQGGFGIANNVLGNIDVQQFGVRPITPQSVTGVEAVLTAELIDSITLDFSLFFQSIQNRIALRPLATDFVAENDSEATNSLGALLNVSISRGRYSGWFGATGLFQVDGDGLSADPLPQFPSIYGTLAASVDIPEAFAQVGASMRWSSSRGATPSNTLLNNARSYSLDPYALFDLTLASVGLKALSASETRISASIRNLFDLRYSEPGFAGFDIPMLGRSFWFELRQVF